MLVGHNPYLTPEAAERLAAVRGRGGLEEMLAAVPFERITSAIESIDAPASYHYLPSTVHGAFSEIEDRFGAARLGLYKKHLIAAMIEALPRKIDALNLPQSVLDLYPDILDVLAQTMADTPDEDYLRGRGIIRELRLASARSVPCGARIVDIDSCAPKTLYRNNGMINNLRCLWFVYARMGGLAPLYRVHVDTRYLKYFNEPGWVQCFLSIAEMLRRNPPMRGVIGTSWFYDPKMEAVSPWLAYLRKRPQEYGAYLRYDGPGEEHTKRATGTSKTRRALYEKGEYNPACYTLVWARKDVLRWAERQG